MKILTVVTNVEMYGNANLKTGLWLGELTHIYHLAHAQGCEITIASPKGGNTPIDPESLKPHFLDRISKSYWQDDLFKRLLENTKSLNDLAGRRFDCVYLAGGHGTMYDFPDDMVLQETVRDHYENGKLVAAVCHGVGGLLNVRLSTGEHLINGKTVTGFSWFEETLARRKSKVPFNLEIALEERGCLYKKALIPMTSYVRVDGNLITGQNPFSSKEIAKKVIEHLPNNG